MSGTHEAFARAARAAAQAAATFAGGPDALEGILLGIVDDVDRAVREPLEIFPVCHHSPASAIAMAAACGTSSRRWCTWSCARTWRRC